jgi:NADH:ubiquinone oxidoreductase subunit F (NADH-binding)
MAISQPTITLDPPVNAPQETPTLPRLLAGIRPDGPLMLSEHLALHGPLPRVRPGGRRRGREQAGAFVEELERSGLVGRGGAGFPAATKMRAVAAGKGRAIVVANGTEGEPASMKDRTLMQTLPHMIIDGGVIAAEAVGADELIIAVCESSQESIDAVALAIEERGEDAQHSPKVQLARIPAHYSAGQETALVNFLGGGPSLPTFTPPRVFEQGIGKRPTLVNNVETLAHIALISRHGSRWFRQLGTPSQPGSTLVTLSGAVAHPGVYEIETGASLTSLIEAGGGPTARMRGALFGGYGGSWVAGEYLRGIALSNEHLAPHGASLGAGVVHLLSEDACPVAETARVARWMHGQSARQCGPCIHGLDALAETLEQIAAGGAPAKAGQRISRLASLTARRGACGHPDGTVKMILSGVEAFDTEFADHARHGHCEQCSRAPELPLPDRPLNMPTPRGKGVRK